ncbi:MAG: hypothetical protein K8F91_15730 [Candidatus Obscuribacterales bacterium]|nr:hypothetical protein [Candidatus Obscuribacterales bacterium]
MRAKKFNLDRFITPNFCLLCRDAIVGSDGSLSLIRLIDEIRTKVLPVKINQMMLVAEFTRNRETELESFENLGLALKVEIVNPAGEAFEIGVWQPSPINREQIWTVHRLLVNMSYELNLQHAGNYQFNVYARTNESDYEMVCGKVLPVFVSSKSPQLVEKRAKKTTGKKSAKKSKL